MSDRRKMMLGYSPSTWLKDGLVVLAGGVGAARFLTALVETRRDPTSRITAITNVGDDFRLHGLAISPDIDTITYTLAGLINPETGWGRADETWGVLDELKRLGGESWFALGDRDLALHLYRTQRLADGATLSEVTAELTTKLDVGINILPVTDDPLRTKLRLAEGDRAGELIDFQDYFVARRHDVAISEVVFEGVEEAQPAPGVIDAITDARGIVIAPSNPFVSIGPLLAVPGVADALRRRRMASVAVSPIIGGEAVKGPAARMMAELGHEPSVVGIAKMYAEFARVLYIDTADEHLADAVEATGIMAGVTDTLMTTPEVRERLTRLVRASATAWMRLT